MDNEQDQFALLGGTGGFNIGNFDPSSIQEDEVILMAIVMDVSPSIQSFEKDLNESFKALIEELQQSHVSSKIMVKIIDFNDVVTEKTGYIPITQIDPKTYTFKASGGGTALFDAAKKAIEATVDYRTHLEATGINVKTLVFVITDGMDVSSHIQPKVVADMLDAISKEERNAFSFETILLGIGTNSTEFEKSQKTMHFKHLAIVGQSAKEIRKMIGFISASVSKSNSNAPISF